MQRAQRCWTRLGDELRASPMYGKKRARARFALLPTRDPKTGKWFWLRRIWKVERRDIQWTALSWGMGVVPSFCWRLEEITRRRRITAADFEGE
jgi:hypothetical protein